MEWPKCKAHNRYGGYTQWTCINGRKTSPGFNAEDLGPCPRCGGTGEKAELTEAEAIAYLCQAPGPVTIRLLNNSHVLIDYNGITIASGEIKRALNEAARAVKERNGA